MIIDHNESGDLHDVMDEKRAALFYLKEAFAEAQLDGLDEDCIAHAALFAAFHSLVTVYGEDAVADFAQRLPDRVRAGCFSSRPRH